MSPIFDLTIEIIFSIGMLYFVLTGADVQYVIYMGTLYLAAVIRHSGKEK